MGISVSHSDGNDRVLSTHSRRKGYSKENEGLQAQRTPPHGISHSPLRQAGQMNAAVTAKKSLQPQEQANRPALEAQKKTPIKDTKGQRRSQLDQPQSAHSSPINHLVLLQNQLIQVTPKNVKQPKQPQKKTQQKQQQICKQPILQKNQIETPKIKTPIKLSASRSQNKSYIVSPLNTESPTPEKDTLNIEIKRISFNQFDWVIPSEPDQKEAARNKQPMPSMNMVLSNKFAEKMSDYKEGEEEEQAARNRRQVMRELLSGKRNHRNEDFSMLSICRLEGLKVGGVCQQK